MHTEKFGVVLLVDDSIRNARDRARSMFGLGPRSVTTHTRARANCDVCDSRPCVCAQTWDDVTEDMPANEPDPRTVQPRTVQPKKTSAITRTVPLFHADRSVEDPLFAHAAKKRGAP